MAQTGDQYPPGRRTVLTNVRLRDTVHAAAIAYADRHGIPLAQAIDHLLATHPDMKPEVTS